MGHHRLKGCKKPKLSKTRKLRAKGPKPGEKPNGEKAEEEKKPPAKPQLGPRGKPLNKKEARQQHTLQRMNTNLYVAGERILLVGEGNFTFARALCKQVGGAGVYATCLDSEAELKQKYPDAGSVRTEIEGTLGGTILTGVDGTRLHKVREFRGAFRKIVFNFPHVGAGEKDVERNVAQHRQLLCAFFISAVKCLDPEQDGQIHVALKTGEPYKSWKVVQTAKAACPELELKTAVPFIPEAWDGYAHRRTAGFNERFSNSTSEELAAGAKVYVFRRPKPEASSDEESK